MTTTATHEGNDPMGAPSTHRGLLENCGAPDCQDRALEQQDDAEPEKLAKARRMAKAFSAPPVAPPGWDATEEWPMRHKRAGDRRVHATAPFLVNGVQRIWTACEKPVGKGGYPLSHMSVDCRDCSRVTTAGEAQQPQRGQA